MATVALLGVAVAVGYARGIDARLREREEREERERRRRGEPPKRRPIGFRRE